MGGRGGLVEGCVNLIIVRQICANTAAKSVCAFIGTEARLLLIATVPIGLRYGQSYSQIYMLTHTPTHTRACTPACVHISRCCWMFVDCCLQFDSLAPSPTRRQFRLQFDTSCTRRRVGPETVSAEQVRCCSTALLTGQVKH